MEKKSKKYLRRPGFRSFLSSCQSASFAATLLHKMTFDGSKICAPSDSPLQEDRFRIVEVETVYRQICCYHCNSTYIYKYKIKQLRRKSEEDVQKGGRLTPEQEEFWRSIPRYAEIPETIRCRHCQEILGLYTDCIF